ncbi:MAG: carbonate dehydratase [Oscillospiraceae bacterium]|nr:carbonate dehydratase [Oscillospiraceae bacterium]
MTENVKQILEFNQTFVSEKRYEHYKSTKYPTKKLAILSCMDTRLTELLPAALNVKNGDVKIIKNAGGVVSHPFGSVMRSLMVAIYELGVKEVLVIGHYDCGMQRLDPERIIDKMRAHGIQPETIDLVRYCGFDLDHWLSGFDDVKSSVISTVETIQSHPFVPHDVEVSGLIMDPETGAVTLLDA